MSATAHDRILTFGGAVTVPTARNVDPFTTCWVGVAVREPVEVVGVGSGAATAGGGPVDSRLTPRPIASATAVPAAAACSRSLRRAVRRMSFECPSMCDLRDEGPTRSSTEADSYPKSATHVTTA